MSRLDFNFSIIQEYAHYFFSGTLLTIGLSIISIIIGTALGLFLALSRLSKKKLISWASTIYIELFRGTPLLVQLLIIYFGVVPLFLNRADGIISKFRRYFSYKILSLISSQGISELILPIKDWLSNNWKRIG